MEEVDMEISRLRNVVFLGPHGVGKTALAESLLYDMGALSSRGKIETGSTTMDFEAEEHQRGMSLGTAR
jgi:elongation factor G